MALKKEQLTQVMDGLGALPEDSGAWRGLMTWLDDAIADANEITTQPTLGAEERAWWAGCERSLRDLKKDLTHLRARTWGQPAGRVE